jgi:hypothetical protein
VLSFSVFKTTFTNGKLALLFFSLIIPETVTLVCAFEIENIKSLKIRVSKYFVRIIKIICKSLLIKVEQTILFICQLNWLVAFSRLGGDVFGGEEVGDFEPLNCLPLLSLIRSTKTSFNL